MKTVFHLDEWESNGYWLCEHTSTYPDGVQKWICPARILGMSVDEFLIWLIDTYKPDFIYHNSDCSFVYWKWKSQEQMRKFKNYINRRAREVNFLI